MKQFPVDKYNIAWFKLAEYVSRGEKERALGIYRLLSHSFEDQAFARQLEGDILWSFNDDGATGAYYEAAQLYKKNDRILQAVAVYEHLATLHPESILYLGHLIDMYTMLNLTAKATSCLLLSTELILQSVKEKNISQESVLENLINFIDRLTMHQDISLLNNFLSRLESTHFFYYQKACQYMKDKE